MERSDFGDSHLKNKAAVRTLPIDFFGSEYFVQSKSLPRRSSEVYARGRAKRLAERQRLIGF